MERRACRRRSLLSGRFVESATVIASPGRAGVLRSVGRLGIHKIRRSLLGPAILRVRRVLLRTCHDRTESVVREFVPWYRFDVPANNPRTGKPDHRCTSAVRAATESYLSAIVVLH